MTVVGLIPARAGSKRLPGKNTLPLAGRPLIAHTCAAAVGSGVLAAVYVNTDSPDIAAVAEQHGAACPTLRPEHLAADDTPTLDSNLFMLDYLARRGECHDAVMILQPTSPLRTADDICAAWKLYQEHAPCSVVSVMGVAPKSWLGTLVADAGFERWTGDATVHRLNGAIYIHSWDEYTRRESSAKLIAYTMPTERSVDIDTRADFEYAEFLLRQAAHAT